jgi:prevent-host-death family protein
MSEKTYSISEIRDEITHLLEYFAQDPEVIAVTYHGKPVIAILPWNVYESLIENLEATSDKPVTAFAQYVQESVESKDGPWS